MPEQLSDTLGTYEYDNPFAGGIMPVVTEVVTLK